MTNQHNNTAPVKQDVQHKCCPKDSIQPVDAQHCQQHVQTTTTQEVPAVKIASNKTKEENLSSSFSVMGIGMLGIFAFMIIFFFMIKLILRLFPSKD